MRPRHAGETEGKASLIVDRYHRFVKAVLAVDSTIETYACGAPVLWGKRWNDMLIAGAADMLRTTADHSLIGGDVPSDTDPLDVFGDFLAVPDCAWSNRGPGEMAVWVRRLSE